jgi:hypothetical protein
VYEYGEYSKYDQIHYNDAFFGNKGLKFVLEKYQMETSRFPVRFFPIFTELVKMVNKGEIIDAFYFYYITFEKFPRYIEVYGELAREIREYEKDLTMEVIFSIEDVVSEQELRLVRGKLVKFTTERLIAQVSRAFLKRGEDILWSHNGNIGDVRR